MKSDSSPSSEKPDQIRQLVNHLKAKQSENYRFVEFKPDSSPIDTKKLYSKQVSFDDINIGYDDDGIPDADDDFGWELYKMRNGGKTANNLPGYQRGRDMLRAPSPAARLSPSPNRNALNYEDLDSRLDIAQLEKNLMQYPTTPITNKRGCTLRKNHKEFDSLYQHRLSVRPMFRDIIVYISGRIHTWVALDWILSKFIENGDHVIIVAAVSPKLVDDKRGRTLSPRRGASTFSPARDEDPVSRLLDRSRPENICQIGANIMDYSLKIINPNIIAKITVEVVVGRTKDVLQDMYRLYEPNLVCTGSKPNMRLGAPLRSWQSSKITDRLVKNFPLPLIAVPAVNMCSFEYSLQNYINQTTDAQNIDKQNELFIAENDDEDDDDDDEIRSFNSLSSDGSKTSYDSTAEIADLYVDYKDSLKGKLTKLEQAPVDEAYFSNILKQISEESLHFCSEVIQLQPSFTGGARLARDITGATFGNHVYKTKSMLEPSSPAPAQHKMSFKEVMESLKQPQKPSSPSPPPSGGLPAPPAIEIRSASNSPSPSRESPSLKFADTEKPSDSDPSKKKKSTLTKCLSYSDDAVNRPKLEVSKSHSGYMEGARDDKKKKKKKKFFGLF
ncbi:hypothetical protein SBY92_003027 [Candida maltosa Xu316]